MALTYSSSVAQQQSALNAANTGKAGYVPLVVDGLLGPKTQSAITNYGIPKTSTDVASMTNIERANLGQGYSNVPGPYNTATGQLITSQSLAPTIPIPFTSPTPTPAYPVSTLATPALIATPQETKATALSDKLQNLYDRTVGESAYRTEQNNVYGIDALTKTQNDLSTQLTTIKNEAAAIPLQLQQGAADRGVTTPVLGRQENSRLRTNAIAALGVSSLLAASQGSLATAQNLVEKAVAQKYDPITEEINATIKNLQLIQNDPQTTLEEKNRAQTQLDAKTNQLADVAQAKADATAIYTVATVAASNGQHFIPTKDYPTLALALDAISKSTTKEAALNIATAVGLYKVASNASNDTTLLSPTEAKTLGVPYGTTRGQAAGLGITPKATTGAPTDIKTATTAITNTLKTGLAPSGQKIGNGRGADGYVDPYVYLASLENWPGTPDSFIKAFPVKSNINPASYKLLPASIQPADSSGNVF